MRSELVGDLCSVDAREVLQVLRGAREHLRGGYCRDWCTTDSLPLPAHIKLADLDPESLAHSMVDGVLRAHGPGIICSYDAEGVRFFDLHGALQAAAGENIDALIVAEDLLWWIVQPEFRDRAWLSRLKLPTLLTAFDRAVLRAQAVSRRKD